MANQAFDQPRPCTDPVRRHAHHDWCQTIVRWEIILYPLTPVACDPFESEQRWYNLALLHNHTQQFSPHDASSRNASRCMPASKKISPSFDGGRCFVPAYRSRRCREHAVLSDSARHTDLNGANTHRCNAMMHLYKCRTPGWSYGSLIVGVSCARGCLALSGVLMWGLLL